MAQLNCCDVIARLVDYLERELHRQHRLEVEAHLRRCDRCVVYMRQYDQVIALAQAAFDEP